MTNPTPSPTDRAAQLGTEHGTEAAHSWVNQDHGRPLNMVEMLHWPKPWTAATVYMLPDSRTAYDQAFRVAVESTIRQACQEVTK